MDPLDLDEVNPDEQVVALEEVCEDLGQQTLEDSQKLKQAGEVLGCQNDGNKHQVSNDDENNVERREDLGQTTKNSENMTQDSEVMSDPTDVSKNQANDDDGKKIDSKEQILQGSTQLAHISYQDLVTLYDSEHWHLLGLVIENDELTDEDQQFLHLIENELKRRRSLEDLEKEIEVLEYKPTDESNDDSWERLLPECSAKPKAEGPKEEEAARAAEVGFVKKEDAGYGGSDFEKFD